MYVIGVIPGTRSRHSRLTISSLWVLLIRRSLHLIYSHTHSLQLCIEGWLPRQQRGGLVLAMCMHFAFWPVTFMECSAVVLHGISAAVVAEIDVNIRLNLILGANTNRRGMKALY